MAATRPEHFLTEGVSCEACHGDGRKWFFEHTDETWREVPGAKKQAEYGQIDLRDPYTRTLKCASCHIGNKAEGKFVTHEMYAAGHPPLPPFELVTFARDAPAHYIHKDHVTGRPIRSPEPAIRADRAVERDSAIE